MAASILIGLNDFNTSPPTDPATIVAEATLGAAAALAQAGFETLIINTLPPPGVFPRFKCADPAVQAAGDVIVSSCNDALAAQAAQLEALGAAVRVIDRGDWLAEADIRGFA